MQLIESAQESISVVRQCELLGISQSSYYYKPRINEFDLELMAKIDEIYTRRPFFGSRRIMMELKQLGLSVGRRKVQALMDKMGIEAIYPKPNLSKPNLEHRSYPYLLRNVKIERPNQVWCSDITYIRMTNGWLYLVAVMDWYSRYILSWELSNTNPSTLFPRHTFLLMRQIRPDLRSTIQDLQFYLYDRQLHLLSTNDLLHAVFYPVPTNDHLNFHLASYHSIQLLAVLMVMYH
ncbi:MAG: hypothetical protein CVU49_02865 [Candidatus Cloacimonetes bacterium HGW-Cloacimonetes-2]|nr:MAG: hypothetical protein CVU49_02865 [Candidatus Cloacimonetes bacterium HGW-Cloacimonetes-2]